MPEMSYEQICKRMAEIEAEMDALFTRAEERGELEPEEETTQVALRNEFDGLDISRKRKELEEDRRRMKAANLARIARSAGTQIERGMDDADSDPLGEPDSIERAKGSRNPWDISQMRWGLSREQRGAELRSRALSAIEKMQGAPTKVRETCTEIIESTNSRTSELLLATSSPDYMRAWVKLMHNNGSPTVLDSAEIAAYNRAMSLTDAAGGYLIPFQLDPNVIITAAGSQNQIRQAARVVQATGDVWNGVSSAGVTGSWDAEAAEVSDDAPTFAQPTIPIYKGAVFVPISLEAAEDEANVAQEIARLIAFETDRMQGVAFAVGSGVGEPTGIVTALIGTASEVASATADTFAVADIYALDNALPGRYRANASWLANRAIYNLVRRFDTQGGANLWTQLGSDVPAMLLGRPAYEAEAMDGTVTALTTNYLAVFGDFNNYVIADRAGTTTIEYIPHLFGANRRPTGQRGWYAHFRVGADSVNDAAFRMLNA